MLSAILIFNHSNQLFKLFTNCGEEKTWSNGTPVKTKTHSTYIQPPFLPTFQDLNVICEHIANENHRNLHEKKEKLCNFLVATTCITVKKFTKKTGNQTRMQNNKRNDQKNVGDSLIKFPKTTMFLSLLTHSSFDQLPSKKVNVFQISSKRT